MKGLRKAAESMGGGVDYLKIADGQAVQVRFAVSEDDIITVYEHFHSVGEKGRNYTCIRKSRNDTSCPLCNSGNSARRQSYLPFIVRGDDETQVKIFKASKTVSEEFLAHLKENGTLNDRDFKIIRNGVKLNTKYTIIPKDKSEQDLSGLEIPDIEEVVAELSEEELIKVVHGAAINDGDDEAPFDNEEDGGVNKVF